MTSKKKDFMQPDAGFGNLANISDDLISATHRHGLANDIDNIQLIRNWMMKNATAKRSDDGLTGKRTGVILHAEKKKITEIYDPVLSSVAANMTDFSKKTEAIIVYCAVAGGMASMLLTPRGPDDLERIYQFPRFYALEDVGNNDFPSWTGRQCTVEILDIVMGSWGIFHKLIDDQNPLIGEKINPYDETSEKAREAWDNRKDPLVVGQRSNPVSTPAISTPVRTIESTAKASLPKKPSETQGKSNKGVIPDLKVGWNKAPFGSIYVPDPSKNKVLNILFAGMNVKHASQTRDSKQGNYKQTHHNKLLYIVKDRTGQFFNEGSGRSKDDARNQRAKMMEFIKQINVEKVNVIGFSRGGIGAINWARDAASQLDLNLVLLDPSIKGWQTKDKITKIPSSNIVLHYGSKRMTRAGFSRNWENFIKINNVTHSSKEEKGHFYFFNNFFQKYLV